MPHVVTHVIMSCAHCAAYAHSQASQPHDLMACHKLIICLLFTQAEGCLLKLTTSHYITLNIQFANENVKRILIAMQDENKSDYNDCLYRP